jgi:two-component system, response regulator
MVLLFLLSYQNNIHMEKPYRILYAEDNLNDVELAVAAFEECNLADRLDVVHNGVEALDYLFCRGKFSNRIRTSPDFIMLDIKMPGVDGIEVLKHIRKSPELKNVPVIMLTSSEMENDIIECYSSGANGYVVKPINFDEFVSAIKGICTYWASINTSPCRI